MLTPASPFLAYVFFQWFVRIIPWFVYPSSHDPIIAQCVMSTLEFMYIISIQSDQIENGEYYHQNASIEYLLILLIHATH